MAILYPLINKNRKSAAPSKYDYIRPIFTYAAAAWSGRILDTNLLKLQIIQNKYLRTALDKPYYMRIRYLHHEVQVRHLLGDVIMRATEKLYEKAITSENPNIRSLGNCSPDTVPYRIKHHTPKHRLFLQDA